jgi:hypothetical protein
MVGFSLARKEQKSLFPALAKIAHAGIKRQGYTSGPLCPLPAVGPPLTFDPAKRFCCLSVE